MKRLTSILAICMLSISAFAASPKGSLDFIKSDKTESVFRYQIFVSPYESQGEITISKKEYAIGSAAHDFCLKRNKQPLALDKYIILLWSSLLNEDKNSEKFLVTMENETMGDLSVWIDGVLASIGTNNLFEPEFFSQTRARANELKARAICE